MAKHTFFCVDAHTCGNPVRVVAGGAPVLRGATMSERRQYFLQHLDWIRTGLMFEPRGHDAMSGSILYPSTRDDCDLGILFIEVSGCLPMCGHGTIGTVTVALEQGLVQPREPGVLYLDTPAGRVTARYAMKGEYVESVQLTNIGSYLHAREVAVAMPELGTLNVDVAYGGNFYAIVEPQGKFEDLAQFNAGDIQRLSPMLRERINAEHEFVHPHDDTIARVSHVQWTGRPTQPGAHARNAVFYGDKGIDRSPCGTGTSARMAQLVARGDLAIGDTFVHESIIGSLFTGCPVATTRVGDFDGIIPTVQGWARITGFNTLIIDERDPYAHGFLLP
ncbi:MAG: 4-hydroxyproline epimerase [Gammaproteobacteria bacterium]|nr:4-hydroxyproline epimerase [Gammaproteobacteria bacterium]